MEKAKLLNRLNLEIEFGHNDEVILLEVMDKENTGKLIIPEFITSIGEPDSPALIGCRFSEIVVDNNGKNNIDLSYAFSNMDSENVRLRIRHPESVISLYGAFSNCDNLREVKFENMNTINLESIGFMFEYCSDLVSIDFGGMVTKNIREMSGVFSECRKLRDIDIGSFDISNVRDIGYMFSNCSSLEYVVLAPFDIKLLTTADSIFDGCVRLKKIVHNGIEYKY